MFDLVIANGTIVDGTGAPRQAGDVAITGDRIAAVGHLGAAECGRRIDASGLIVAPGFIDAHSHSDFTIPANPMQQSTIRQGVTTEIVGNCGLGCAPVSDVSRASMSSRLEAYAWDRGVSWSSFGEFLDLVDERGTSENFAWFVGHNALREAAGVEGSACDREQLGRMRAYVAEAMDAGALGMSTGLEFEPGRLASPEELASLLDVVRERGGIYASHIRNRDAAIQAAVEEFFELAAAAGGRGQLSHLNVRHNTGAPEGAWERAVATLERRRSDGMDVFADATPMRTGDGVAAAILPPWLMADGPSVAAARLRDRSVRARVRGECDRYWRFIHRGEWQRVRLLSSAEYPELCGLTFPEISERLGRDEWDCYFDILAAAGENIEGVSLIAELFTEEMSSRHVAHPLFLLGADTMSTRIDGLLSAQTRHPLHFSAHAYFLTHHVRERGTLSLETAVRKMTSMVADRFGLAGRGRLEPGGFADLVVFDFERLEGRSTLAQPLAYATGVEVVLVNGVPVIQGGEHTGARPGVRLVPS